MEPPFPIVRLRWHDAVSQSGWTAPAETCDPPLCTSIGFLVWHSRTVVTIAATFQADSVEETEVNNYISIPAKMVQRIDVLTDTGWQPYKKPRRDTVKPIIAPPDAAPLP